MLINGKFDGIQFEYRLNQFREPELVVSMNWQNDGTAYLPREDVERLKFFLNHYFEDILIPSNSGE